MFQKHSQFHVATFEAPNLELHLFSEVIWNCLMF